MPLGETANLVVRLNLEGNLNKELGKTTASLKGVATQTKSLSSQVKGSVLTGVGLGAGLVGFNLLAKGIGLVTDGIQSAVDEEASIAQLTRSIQENAEAWNGNIRAVEDVIKARQALAFTDDEQRDSLRSLVAVTKNVEEALRVQGIAMDFARLRGIDLATATQLLGKVYGGNLGILSRYGIQLAKGTTATEALAEIQKRAAGQAEEFADSTGGRAAVAAIKFSEAMESVGRIAVPVVGFLADGLGSLADTIDTLVGGGDTSLDALIVDLQKTAGTFKEAGEAAADTEGQWALAGTGADSLIDALHNVRDAAADIGLLPGLVKEDEWRTALASVQQSLGLTDDQIKTVITEATALGLTLDQTRDSLTRASAVAGNQKMWAAMGDAMRETADGAEELTEEVKQGRSAVVAYRRAVNAAGDAIEDTAGQVDLAKGSFKGFWDSVREQQRRIRYFIRHPEALRRETNRIENTLSALERQRTQIERGGIQQRERLQYQAITNLINQLRSRRGEFYQVGLSAGNAAEQGMEDGFSPRLTARINAVLGGIGGAIPTKEKRAVGGAVQAWHTYQVNENGPEYLTMGGRGGWISPRGPVQTSKRDVLDIRVQPIITAFQVGRELGRAATTRRSGAGVL